MPSSNYKQGGHSLTNISHNSIQTIKTLLSPCHPRQLSKLLSLNPKTSPPKPPIKSTPKFPHFSQLPFEIRTMIWIIYFSFPRIHIPSPSSNPTNSNPWPLIILRSPHLHPALYISHETRSIYQQFTWIETLHRMHKRTLAQSSSSSFESFRSPSFMTCLGNDLIDWDNDIFWFKGLPTLNKLVANARYDEWQRLEDVRKVAFDYKILDCEDLDDIFWRGPRGGGCRRNYWFGLVKVLLLFEFLEEVYFVLDVEGGVKGNLKGCGELSFEVIDVEERKKIRLDGVNEEADKEGDGLRFPQVDDRGFYPALEWLFSNWEQGGGWQRPKVQFVYARNIG